MNKRRRFKAHRRRREVRRTMAVLRVDRASAVVFLRERYKPKPVPVRVRSAHERSLRFERAFPGAYRAMLNRGGGPHGADWP